MALVFLLAKELIFDVYALLSGLGSAKCEKLRISLCGV
jgi:hypothetical protein